MCLKCRRLLDQWRWNRWLRLVEDESSVLIRLEGLMGRELTCEEAARRWRVMSESQRRLARETLANRDWVKVDAQFRREAELDERAAVGAAHMCSIGLGRFVGATPVRALAPDGEELARELRARGVRVEWGGVEPEAGPEEGGVEATTPGGELTA